jgi:hypothetical protein
MLIVYGTLAVLSQICHDLVFERTTGLRHLQVLMGVTPVNFWIANYVWDMLKCAFICGVMLAIMAVGAPGLASGPTLLVLFMFFATAVLWTYSLSNVFTDPKCVRANEPNRPVAQLTPPS